MSIQHQLIFDDGDAVAQIISLGERWVLYSTHLKLRSLDGQVFDSKAEAHRAAEAQLAHELFVSPVAA